MDSFYLEILKKNSNSSRNVRYSLMLLIIACIIIFTGLWNSIEIGWIESRIKIHQNQLNWIEYIIDDRVPETFTEEEQDLFIKAKTYYLKHNYTEEILKHQLENLYTLQLDNVIYVKIPFFGIVIDVNDLGLIGGFTLVVLYFVLLYSYVHRRNHLETSLNIINNMPDDNIKNHAYTFLAMDQVLTVPRATFNYGKYLRKVPRALYLLPIITYAMVFIYDILTFNKGAVDLNSMGKTIILYVFSGLFFIILLIETIFCFIVMNQTDDFWQNELNPRLASGKNTEQQTKKE